MSDLFQHSKRIHAKLKLISKENVKHPINVLFTLRIMVHHFPMGELFPLLYNINHAGFCWAADIRWGRMTFIFSKSVQADNRIKAMRVCEAETEGKPEKLLLNVFQAVTTPRTARLENPRDYLRFMTAFKSAASLQLIRFSFPPSSHES